MADSLKGFVDYQRREYCRDVQCPVQNLLDKHEKGSDQYNLIHKICEDDCLHTTHEFHKWLIDHDYLLVRPE